MARATTHTLERTSPLGERFVGRCILCGAEGLRASDALQPCPNLLDATTDDALIAAIEGPLAKNKEQLDIVLLKNAAPLYQGGEE